MGTVGDASVSSSGLDALLRPHSIAVIGASDDPSRVGGMPIAFLREVGFAGEVYPVNPHRETVQGLAAYPSIDQVPTEVDLVIVALRADLVPLQLRRAAENGARSAVVFSAGFAEIGKNGQALQEELVSIAREFGIPVLGPNCAGLVAVRSGAIASFGSHLAADANVTAGSVGIVSQSGAVGAYLLTLTRRMGIGLSYWVTTGNEAVTSISDYIGYLAGDVETRVIAVYVEQIADVNAFAAACAAARAASKQVVVLVGGTTSASEAARLSHTAALAGDYRLLKELIRDCGAVEVDSLSSLLSVSVALERHGASSNRGIAVLTMSGAAGVLIADRCAQRGLELVAIEAELQDCLREIVPFAGTANPVDVTGNLANAPETFRSFLRLIGAADGVTSLVVFLGHLPLSPHLRGALVDTLVEHGRSNAAPLFLVALLHSEDEERIRAAGIQVFADPADAVDAIAAAAAPKASQEDAWRPLLCRRQENPERTPAHGPDGQGLVSEEQSQRILAPLGIRFPRQFVVHTVEEAVRRTSQIDGPVVLKVLSPDIAHKSDVGGVRVGVAPADAASAFLGMLADVRSRAPGSRIEGALVQEQIADGPHLLLGAAVDAHFGPYTMVGWGGTLTEYIGQVAIGLAPLNRREARVLIRRSGLEDVLAGVRGSSYDARDELAGWIENLSEYVWQHRERLCDLELNPVIVGDRGLVAVDALVRLNDGRSEQSVARKGERP
ncbi:acetate--CoA ligase family protein [Rhizomonospora bruguierae]|uniref:acetate--CoA ligase family protein n=1 Tax=Rhizomonospora bruguierae TaxID=1581705 RepID=UPI001BD139B1|nr:acetate--CoA ligase family protein [Micromonospora sp. NBRC 107566]